MRASDQDREAALALLRARCAEGYLSVDTFERRVEQTFAARTVGELRGVVADVSTGGSWLRRALARPRRRAAAGPVAGRPAGGGGGRCRGRAAGGRADHRRAQPPLRRRARRPDRLAPPPRAAPGRRRPVGRRRRRVAERHVAAQPARRAHAGRARRRARARLLPDPPGLSGPRPRARAKGAAVAAAALALAAFAAALSGGGPAPPARVSVDSAAPGRAVPATFLGMSMEATSVAPFGGPGREGIVRLLRRLEAARGAPMPLRVGGASADETWWDPSGRRPRPPGVRHAIGPPTLAALDGLSRGLRAPVTIGLDLQIGDPANALASPRSSQRQLGARLAALEIGNEPDLYTRARGFGPDAVRRLRKRERYTPADYVRDAGRYLDALSAGLPEPRPRLVVGGFAGSPAFTAALPGLIAAHRPAVGAVAAHRYGVSACALDP